MYRFLLLFLALLLNSSTCKKKDCQRKLIIKNESSSDTVVFATLIHYRQECALNKKVILKPNDLFEYTLRGGCWEHEIKERGLELFFVNPAKYNVGPTAFYSCDSIEERNDILLRLHLTEPDIEKLQQNNFTISYQ